jgi:hypothetical protein
MELAIQNIKKVLMAQTNSNLIFGFAFPIQFWKDNPERTAYNEVGNINVPESKEKLKKAYENCGFLFLEDLSGSEILNEQVEADKKRDSKLFFQVY